MSVSGSQCLLLQGRVYPFLAVEFDCRRAEVNAPELASCLGGWRDRYRAEPFTRILFATGMIALGILGRAHGDFALQWQPVPAWLPCEIAVLLAGGWVLFAKFADLPENPALEFALGPSGTRIARYLFAIALLPIGLATWCIPRRPLPWCPHGSLPEQDGRT